MSGDFIVITSLLSVASLLSLAALWSAMKEWTPLRWLVFVLLGVLWLGFLTMDGPLRLTDCVPMEHGMRVQCSMEQRGAPLKLWGTKS
jgi:hypothetical protein